MSHVACSSACVRPEAGRSAVYLRRPAPRGASLRPARAASVEVSNNASEARAWIEAWRAKQPGRGSHEQGLRSGIRSAAAKQGEDHPAADDSDAVPGSTSSTEETLETIQEESLATQRRLREQTAALAAHALQAAMHVQVERSKQDQATSSSADTSASSKMKRHEGKAAEVPEELLQAAAQPSSPDIQRRLREEAAAAGMPEDVVKAAITRQLERSGVSDPAAPPKSAVEGITDELMSSIEIQDRLRDDVAAMSAVAMKAAISRQLERSKNMADDFDLEGSSSPPTQAEKEAASVEAQARLREEAADLADEVVKAAIAQQLARSSSNVATPDSETLIASTEPSPEEEPVEEADPFKDSIEVQEAVRERAAVLAEDLVQTAIARQLQNSAGKPRGRRTTTQDRQVSIDIQKKLRNEVTAMSDEVMKAAISRQLEGAVPAASTPLFTADTAQAASSASSSSSSSASKSQGDGDMITYTAEQLDAISLEEALKNIKP